MAAEGKAAKGGGKKAPAKAAAKKPREIKDAGQRTVLAAFEMGQQQVAGALAEAAGITLKGLSEKDAEKALKPFLDRVAVPTGEKVQVWVKIGQVKADGREDAVDQVVGEKLPGEYRAPNASAWRGRVSREIPDEVPLNVTVVDD